ncbi:MAG: hypothetical protein A4E35_01794 [Methanoregula sp. PtaU1.Bin051]|nr:MAG: hypothetical protein A4E35_01794 [Methanoregula sp. PtaU1.Bin051]
MDKATRTQFSLAFFAIGFSMIVIQDLKKIESIPLGITQYFPVMFYLGLIFMVIGYYLR